MAGVLMMSGPVTEAAYVCVCCGEMLDRPAEEFKSETWGNTQLHASL